MSRIRADKLVNRVGSGGPTFPNGVADGFSVAGVVTATSFRGDGSSLTGIDASSLKDGSNVKVQATPTGATVTGTLIANVTGNVTGNVTSSGANTLGSLTVSGNVGIGTTNPGSKLEVHSDSVPKINSVYQGSKHFGMSVGSVGGGLVISDGHFMTIVHQPYADRETDANLTERIRITSSGNVGINSTAPTGTLDVGGNILPDVDNTRDLGSASKRWANIYTGDLNLSNEGAVNDVDGTWGQYTIQEGENDLFLINRRTGKKYKFNLTEVN